MQKKYFKNIPLIGGKNNIVKVDESKFGKRKYNRGHSVDGIWLVGFVERTPLRRFVLIPVEKRDTKTLTEILGKYIIYTSLLNYIFK